MATLEKIRSKGVLLLIVVGVAMIVFIVGDFVGSGSTYFNELNSNVAKINGNDIGIREYSDKLQQFNDVVAMEYGAVNSEMTEQISQMVWDNTVRSSVIDTECKKIGMMVTADELYDIVLGNYTSPLFKNIRMFNNQDGQFDPNNLRNFLNAIESEETTQNMSPEELNKYRNYWRYWENAIKSNRLEEKYRTLLTKSMVANPLDAKYSYENGKTTATVVYAMKNYSAIADSTITVSDSEITTLYNEKKEQFTQEQSADIDYIAITIKPSREDYNEAEKWINELRPEFMTTNEVSSFTNSNSDVSYSGENLTYDQIDPDFKEFAMAANADSVSDLMFLNDTYKMARVVEKGIMSPDSVKLSHIYLRAESAERVQEIADSIETALKGGANFAALAAQYSIGQTAQTGGEIGWISEMGLDKEIARPAFSTKANETFQVKNGNDINLFLVNDVKENVEKIKLAVIARNVDASSRTRTDLYNKANQFIVENNTLELFNDSAARNGYNVMRASNVNINASALNSTKNVREVVRWAFENKPGKVCHVVEIDGYIILAAVRNIKEKGHKPMSEVKAQLTAEVRKGKKGDILTAEMSGKTMSQLAAEGFTVDTIQSVNFASNYAGAIGNEPALFARIATTEVNKESAPLKGNNGAFLFKTIQKEESTKPFDEKAEKVMLNSRENYTVQYQYIETLKKAADIEDLRYKFY